MTIDAEAEALLESLRQRGVPEEDLGKLREFAVRWAETDEWRRKILAGAAAGGRSTSPAKAEAARRNGRRGGRPRKKAAQAT